MTGNRSDYLGRRLFLRRSLLGAGAAVLLMPFAAAAQQKPPAHVLKGDVRINGRRANTRSNIRPGDTVKTGADGEMRFVINEDVYLLRSNSELQVEGVAGRITVFSGLLLVSGGLAAAFASGIERRIATPTATAGIRGTGVYLEASGSSTYFCTCYGTVELQARGSAEKSRVVAARHEARTIGAYGESGGQGAESGESGESGGQGRAPGAARGGLIRPAPFINHTDQEMIALEAAVGRPNPFEGKTAPASPGR
jgi:hypothetical protein